MTLRVFEPCPMCEASGSCDDNKPCPMCHGQKVCPPLPSIWGTLFQAVLKQLGLLFHASSKLEKPSATHGF